MLCCSVSESKMNRRADYKIAAQDDVELEPLGVTKATPEHKTNGINKFGNRRNEGPVKLSVVGGGGPGSSIWRRERIVMGDADLDDVAFLTGNDSNSGRPQREGVAVCSQKRALCVTAIVLGALLASAIIIAYAGPQSVCPCAGKIPPGYVPEGVNNTEPFQPIATNGQPFPWLQPYLPSHIRPIRYTLTIHPNLTTLDVKGQVTIELHVDKETNFIVLHAQDLNITEKAIVGPKGYQLKIVKLLEYPPRQQIYIELKDRLRKKSNYTLSIRWYSRLVHEPEGFYVDEYDTSGFQRLLAATVLGPGTARKAFPCFDEPHLRAPFKISLFRDRFHIGLSNSLVHTTDDVGFYMGTGLLRDDFNDTPPLPADAISWVVSDFRREILEPSSTYQTTRAPVVTSMTPKQLSPPTTAKSLTDNLVKQNGDKKLVRNITAILREGLVVQVPHVMTAHDTKHATTTSENLTVEKNATNKNGNGQFEVTKAPSYTFYASNDTLKKTKFILYTSRDVLEHLQVWLGVHYPLDKLDFVALPSLNDELVSSLGLISCRSSFLRESDTITTKEYHKSALEISEAIVKQYFGGVVSPKIWKHAWLWEGLIKYLSRIILAPLQPLWPMDELHLMETVIKALDNDAVQGWESILLGTSETGNNEDFYVEKSAGLLSMLHSAIGDNDFRACLGTFISAFKFNTAEPIDLWAICKKKVNGTKNIKEMMNLWTTLPGFPLLNVTKSGQNVTIRQKPFMAAEFLTILEDPSFDNDTEDGSTTTSMPTTTTTLSPKEARKRKDKWIFPVNYITNAEQIADSFWFNSSELDFTIHYDVKWIKINAGQHGYYRVLYDEANWNNLIEQLKINHNVFSAKDRIGLVSDAFTLCHANLMSCQITMNLISYLPKELDWGPMTIALRHLERWRKILKYSECYLLLAEYVKNVLARSVMEIGWTDSGKDEIRLVRPEVLMASVLWEETEGIAQAKALLHNHITNGSIIPPNLRSVAYIGAVLSGEFLYWQFCWDRYTTLRKDKDRQDERYELLRALGVTKDAWLQNRLLTHVSSLPPNEIAAVLEAIAGTPTGGAMACRFLQAKWFSLQAKLGKGTINFARAISAITQYGASRFDYDELKSLVERFGEGPGVRALNMTLKTVAGNVEWVTRSQSSIYTWVERNYRR